MRSWLIKLGYNVKITPRVVKYLGKLKDKKLKSKFLDIIYDEISVDPYKGTKKKGDLSELCTVGFRYAKTDYRIAYIIENDVIVILAGTHERFYESLKRFL